MYYLSIAICCVIVWGLIFFAKTADAGDTASLIDQRPGVCVYRAEWATFEMRHHTSRACPTRLRIFAA
jgi:hypothetical protein